MGNVIVLGDCVEKMREMDEASVDAIVCDPPYDLTAGKKGGSGPASSSAATPYGRARITTGFMGKGWDGTGVAFKADTWLEALRVLKPGGHLLAFGGTRTFHRLTCAIEDAGFEIRDCLMWLYGTGFPKSLNVSKAIDKAAGAKREVVGTKLGLPGYSLKENDTEDHARTAYGKFTDAESECEVTGPATEDAKKWEGYGTALKPAWEPIIMARKPLIGTVAANVLEHGTGALNIDGCRIGTSEDLNGGAYATSGGRADIPGAERTAAAAGMMAPGKTAGTDYKQPQGRWPANLIHDGSDEVVEMFPQTMPGAGFPAKQNTKSWKMSSMGKELAPARKMPDSSVGGSASRFFYCAKANKKERGEGNTHPTVKPLALIRYLCRLVTPPGGRILDPFAGSGTTLLAAKQEGFSCIGIEQSAEYVKIMQERTGAHLLPR